MRRSIPRQGAAGQWLFDRHANSVMAKTLMLTTRNGNGKTTPPEAFCERWRGLKSGLAIHQRKRPVALVAAACTSSWWHTLRRLDRRAQSPSAALPFRPGRALPGLKSGLAIPRRKALIHRCENEHVASFSSPASRLALVQEISCPARGTGGGRGVPGSAPPMLRLDAVAKGASVRQSRGT